MPVCSRCGEVELDDQQTMCAVCMARTGDTATLDAMMNTTLPTGVVKAPALEGKATSTVEQDVGISTKEVVIDSSDGSKIGVLPKVGTALGHYELIRELGRGGMGAVFLARDTRLGRRVAIKFLTAKSRELAERFITEARTTARCRHENIVVIHDVNEYHNHPYMVLEYIEGPTLRMWLDQRNRTRRAPSIAPVTGVTQLTHERAGSVETTSTGVDKPVPPILAVELMVPVVRALVCAHELGIVHCDLKPANIILVDAGGIKVLDFGIARLLENARLATFTDANSDTSLAPGASMVVSGEIIGTMPYMSPEQWTKGELDHRSDIWAVGVLLFEMILGRHPLEPLSPRKLFQWVADVSVPMPRVSDMLPDIGGLGPIIDRCLIKNRADRTSTAATLLAELEPLLPGHRALDVADDESPFAGLAAFQEADYRRFFGREREIGSVMARLRNFKLVAITGPSGAGKSSFVRAGVIPALKRSGEGWEAFVIRPGRHPLSALAAVIIQVAVPPSTAGADGEVESSQQLIETLRAQPGYLGARLRAYCAQTLRRVVLFVDQFEELYTLSPDMGTRAAFAACLEGAADDETSPLRVILALRSDFLDRVAADREFMRAVTRGLMFLPAIQRDGLRDALIRPVEQTGHRFESPDVVDGILDTLKDARCPLPLLQFAASSLWDARDRERRLLTKDSHDRLGGIAGALSSHADAVLAGLSARDRSLVRAVFLRLVTPERTRAVVSMAELRLLDDESHAVEQIVHHLANARLLLIETGDRVYESDADDPDDGSTVEIVHESLIERWSKLARWLDENQGDAEFLTQLQAAAKQWDASGRSADLLWRGQAALDAKQWFERRRGRPSGRVELDARSEAFLLAVVGLAMRARRRRLRIAGGVFAFLMATALVVSYLAVQANRAAARAERQALRADLAAERARAEAVEARNANRMSTAREMRADPTTTLALVREIEPGELPRGWSALAQRALQRGVASVVLPHDNTVQSASFSPDGERIVTASRDKKVRVWRADGLAKPTILTGHRDWVHAVSFSTDGRRIVSASFDGTARVWNAVTRAGETIVLGGHRDRVYAAAFSPDGTQVVTASADGTARVYRADGDGEPQVLTGHTDRVYSAVFSPDGSRIATASYDTSTRVHTVDGTREPLVLIGHRGWVTTVAFAPDGHRLVTGSVDNTARVYDLNRERDTITLIGHTDAVMSVAFSPDGTRVATASYDKTAIVQLADGSGEHLVLRGHSDRVHSVAFSPDGTRVVTASGDGSSRVYNIMDVGRPMIFRGHTDRVRQATFSSDGTRIVTASADKTARVYRADGTGEPIVLTGHTDSLTSAVFSPNGLLVATASFDRTVRLHRSDGTGESRVLRGHTGGVYSVAFSPNGARIVTSSRDRTARIVRVDGTGDAVILDEHGDSVYTALFSPDGASVVTACGDGNVRVFRADGAGAPMVLDGHQDRVYGAIFSADGSLVATGSADKSAHLFWLDGTSRSTKFTGFNASVTVRGGRAFSPDGARFAAASEDKTIRIWNVDGTGSPMLLIGPDAAFNSVMFSPDGTRIVAGSDDNTAWMWTDLKPLEGRDDDKLWTATTYCMPVELRQRLLGVNEELARAERDACMRRVREARRH